jgi:hypothetical protein
LINYELLAYVTFMNKEQFFLYLVPRVQTTFNSLGFGFKKSKDGFLKDIDDGWLRVYFSYYKFAETDNINMGFEVRKNTVEQIYVKYVDINPSNHKTVPTVILPLTGICRHSDNYFAFTNEAELDDIMRFTICPFLETRLAYLAAKYSDLYNIFKLYRYDQEEYHYLIEPKVSNYVRTLILGRMVFSGEDFDKVVAWAQMKIGEKMAKNVRRTVAEKDGQMLQKLVFDLMNSSQLHKPL